MSLQAKLLENNEFICDKKRVLPKQLNNTIAQIAGFPAIEEF